MEENSHMQTSAIAPEIGEPRLHSINLKRILVPVDFSGPSQQALTYALRFAKEFGSEVTLFHVIEKHGAGSGLSELPAELEYSNKQLTKTKNQLRALSASSRTPGSPTIRSVIRKGLPSHEIVEAAKDLETDLIVIATHGYTGWKHFCIGSVTERVVRAAPCPVFVVREKEHDFI
jgi:universal stress protein A